jgi:hypothetical protein
VFRPRSFETSNRENLYLNSSFTLSEENTLDSHSLPLALAASEKDSGWSSVLYSTDIVEKFVDVLYFKLLLLWVLTSVY